MKLILIALALFSVIPVGPVQQPSAAPAAQGASARARLAGDWKVDRRQFPDEQDVWRRRIDAMSVDPATAAVPPSSTRVPDPLLSSPVGAGGALDIAKLRTAMRDLLETAERQSFRFAPDSVTITDDLNRSLTYATTGKKENRQLAATRFAVKTRWNGDALTQELTVWSFAMTEVYLTKDDGQELLISIKIDKPAFQPPIKDIARVYTRIR